MINAQRVIVRYSNRVETALIAPCKSGMFRIVKPRKHQQEHLPRAVRIAQIKAVVNHDRGLSYSEISRRVGLERTWVTELMKSEGIQR